LKRKLQRKLDLAGSLAVVRNPNSGKPNVVVLMEFCGPDLANCGFGWFEHIIQIEHGLQPISLDTCLESPEDE